MSMKQNKKKNLVVSRVLTVVLALMLAVLQTTLIHGISVFHTVPYLLFIAVVCYSLLHADYSALVFAAVCGLLLDVTGGRTVGVNTLFCLYAAYFCVRISGSLFNNNVFVSMVFVMLLSIPYELFTYVLYFAVWGQGAFGYAFLCKILPVVLYNFLMTLIIYPVTRSMTGWRA